MFKRRKSQSTLKKLRETVWPSMGWARFFDYVRKRVFRLNDTPENIAAGLALGVSISFTPFFGTHILQVFIMGYFTRLNAIAGTIATSIGNPITFIPFFWGPAIIVGALILSWFGIEISAEASQFDNVATLVQAAKDEPLHIFLPWLIGGYLLALLSWPICYLIFYPIVKAERAARQKIINAARAKWEERKQKKADTE